MLNIQGVRLKHNVSVKHTKRENETGAKSPKGAEEGMIHLQTLASVHHPTEGCFQSLKTPKA